MTLTDQIAAVLKAADVVPTRDIPEITAAIVAVIPPRCDRCDDTGLVWVETPTCIGPMQEQVLCPNLACRAAEDEHERFHAMMAKLPPISPCGGEAL